MIVKNKIVHSANNNAESDRGGGRCSSGCVCLLIIIILIPQKDYHFFNGFRVLLLFHFLKKVVGGKLVMI